MAGIFWHNLSIKDTTRILKTNPSKGLNEEDVRIHQKEFGKNSLPEEESLSGIKIFLKQLESPLIYILLIAGLITFFLREYGDSIIIFGSAVVNVIVGFIQENKASNALKELKKVGKSSAQVLREGNFKIVDSEELVPGDVLILHPGDKVPADGRIIECYNLKINEMILTGEWLPADKLTPVIPEETPLADRDNMVYMGTTVEDGKAKIVITETGIRTEIGKITRMIRETKEKPTPYQEKIASFSKTIGLIIVFICLFILLEGLIKGRDFTEIFITSIAVAVAAIPEGLPVCITVILTLGMQKILKQQGLVKKLAAAETLGSTSIIATDKTGTITEGKMKVDQVLSGSNILEEEKNNPLSVLRIAGLCSEAFIENPQETKENWIIRGKPTDKALLLGAIEAGIDIKKEKKKLEEIQEMPFDPINKYLARLYKVNGEKGVLFVCGAPEKILEFSKQVEVKKEKKNLTLLRKEKIKESLNNLTGAGQRVVAVAYKNIDNVSGLVKERDGRTTLCQDLIFVGLIGLKDPLRKEVKKAIQTCKRAGIKTIIVTGDHKLTAKAIAKEIGLPSQEENIIEGKDLDKLSDEEFQKIIEHLYVYARVEPKHKTRIVENWQNRGEVVAMTGDGINDAPALKKADVGMALGSGTDVAKEVADLILLNDNFSIIVAAVEEGRKIMDNIRKVITYLLADSFTETILIGLSILGGLPLPVSAAQILWVNLIEDGLPDISLAFEPKEKDIMINPPMKRNAPLLTKEMKTIIFVIGILSDLMLMGIFWWLWQINQDITYVRSVVFIALATDSLFFLFSCKSLRQNLWHINIFSNKFLTLSFVVGILMLFSAIYFPPFSLLLKTVPIHMHEWLIIFALGLTELILIEAVKHHFIIKKQAI